MMLLLHIMMRKLWRQLNSKSNLNSLLIFKNFVQIAGLW